MPDLDGPQTLEVLRRLDPDVRACFISADTGAYDQEQLRRLGAACFVTKPFRLEDLANVLRLVTQGVPAGLLPAGGTSPCVSPGDNVHRGGADADTPCGR
jgi:CheY-like chemotaxis protein